MKTVKGIPIVGILLVAVAFGAFAGATWYYSSSPYSFTINVSGWMTAKAIDPASLAGLTTLGDVMALPELPDFIIEGDERVLYVVFTDTNAERLYTTVTATVPGGASMECIVGRSSWNIDTLAYQETFDTISVFDGSAVVNLESGGEPLFMFGHNPGANAYRLLRLAFTTNSGSLEIGNYPVTDIIVIAGDGS